MYGLKEKSMGVYLRGNWHRYKKQIGGQAYHEALKIKRGILSFFLSLSRSFYKFRVNKLRIKSSKIAQFCF